MSDRKRKSLTAKQPTRVVVDRKRNREAKKAERAVGLIPRIRRRPPKHKFAASLESAAAILSLSIDVLRAARNKGCQAFRSNGSVHLGELSDFIAEHQELYSDSDSVPSTAIEKAKDARAVRQIREHRLAVLRGSYLPLDQVKRTLVRIAIAAKNKILAASKTSVALGAAKSALTPEQTKPILDELETRLHDALAELATSDLGKPQCPFCLKTI